MISKDEITTEVYACMSAMDQSSLDYVLDALPRLAEQSLFFRNNLDDLNAEKKYIAYKAHDIFRLLSMPRLDDECPCSFAKFSDVTILKFNELRGHYHWGSVWGDRIREEYDFIKFKDTATGYVCMMTRNKLKGGGTWCAYVRVEPNHPLFRVNTCLPSDYRKVVDALECPESVSSKTYELDVHGGITWQGIDPEERAEGWWIGFDCLHSDDLSAGSRHLGCEFSDIYVCQREVIQGVIGLAKQLKEMEIEDGE